MIICINYKIKYDGYNYKQIINNTFNTNMYTFTYFETLVTLDKLP